jgi:phage terminase small subunit
MPHRGYNENNLTDKEQSFCDAYLCHGEALRAFRESKYKKTSDKNGSVMAATILRRVRVKEYLQKKRAEQTKRLEISADRIKLEMARIALLDPRKLYDEDGKPKPINELDTDTAAAIKGVKGSGKYSLWSKDKQLENLARVHNLFEDDRRAGAINISFNQIPEERRRKLTQMLDNYYSNARKGQEPPKLLLETAESKDG